MESRRSLLWKYFAVCEDDATKAECTICKTQRLLYVNSLRSFSFPFNSYSYAYSAEYCKPIFGTALLKIKNGKNKSETT